MGMQLGGSSEFNSEINVTPMVDIMLVLLIIFMVVTPLLQHGVTVSLPQNMNNPDEDTRINNETAIVIAIPNDGEYYLGKTRIQPNQLERPSNTQLSQFQEKVEELLSNIKELDDRIVYIKSGVGVSYGQVVDIINQVRAVGVDKIGLVADKKKKGGSTAPAA